MDSKELDTIDHASDLVNSTLISKAYIDDRLRFLSIDFEELLGDQIKDFKVTDEIFNNDKNTINIIYSLLQALDRNKVQHKASNRIIAHKETTIESLNSRVVALESKLEETEAKLIKVEQVDKSELSNSILELTKINKQQALDLQKLRIWAADIGAKYHVERRKKELEIDQLKNKLISRRSLSTTVSMGFPSAKSSPIRDDTTLSLNIVYNSTPIIDNTQPTITNLDPIIKKECDEMVAGLNSVIESLVSENYKLSAFIRSVDEYFAGLNTQLTLVKKQNVTLPNPSSIDLTSISNVPTETAKRYFEEMELFEYVAKPLMNNIYNNYHNIMSVIDFIELSSISSLESDAKKISQLTEELELAKRNWKDAIQTLEDWRKFLRR